MRQRGRRGRRRGDGDGVGHRPERGGERGLGAALDVHQGRDGAQDPGQVGGEQRSRAVLARQRQRERVATGRPGRPLPLGLALLPLQRGEGLLGLRQPGARRLVALVQPDLAVVEPTGLLLQRRELGPRAVGPGARLGQRRGEPTELGLGGRGPRAQRPDLPGQPGQPLPTVGDGADRRHERPLRRRQRRLEVGAPGHGVLEPCPVLVELAGEGGLGVADLRRLALERLRVAQRPRASRGRRRQVPVPLDGERRGAPQPLLQGGEAVPGLLRGGEPRRLLGRGRLTGLLLALHLPELGLDGGASLEQGLLVAHLRLQRGAQGDQVVGEQPQPGVAPVGLHGLRPTRQLGLPTERLELPTDLGGEVAEPGEPGLHGVELAQGLLLALLVLEDPGGLLDEGPPVLGPRRQHRVELALPHDDVQLAADAAVAEQLLHVDEPAPVAVDGVLRLPGAEHQPPHGDLGVVDRQRTVAVVDRQRHLGAAERRPAGRAGEDDVLHLAAAQRLGALLAQHPGHRVDDVALARAVGPDDARDAGLEAQRRR